MRRFVFIGAILISLLAQEQIDFDDDFDDDVSDFSSSANKTIQTPKENFLDDFLSGFSYGGKISILSSYNYIDDIPLTNGNNIQGLSSLKFLTNLDIEYKINKDNKAFAGIKGYYDDIYSLNSSNYQNIPQGYEEEFELGEAYITGKVNEHMDYKIGRQIVVWGKSDSLRVADMLNPMDNKNPAITDIENLRLPVGMIKIDWYDKAWQYGIIDIYEQRFSKMPKYGSGYTSQELPQLITPPNKQQIAL